MKKQKVSLDNTLDVVKKLKDEMSNMKNEYGKQLQQANDIINQQAIRIKELESIKPRLIAY